MKAQEVTDIIRAIGKKIEEEKDFLTELDNVIGDGDHGINMARGFQTVLTKLDYGSCINRRRGIRSAVRNRIYESRRPDGRKDRYVS